MPSLSADDQSAVRFHLGYGYTGLISGDLAILNEVMNNLPDAWTVTKVSGLIARCETAYALTQIDAGTIVNNTSETFDKTEGSPAVVTASATLFGARASYNLRYRNYDNETSNLALVLGVVNYRQVFTGGAGGFDFW